MRIGEPPNPWSTWFLTYSSLSVSRYGGNDIIRLTTWQAQPQRKGGSFKSLIQNARERSEQITYCIILYENIIETVRIEKKQNTWLSSGGGQDIASLTGAQIVLGKHADVVCWGVHLYYCGLCLVGAKVYNCLCVIPRGCGEKKISY